MDGSNNPSRHAAAHYNEAQSGFFCIRIRQRALSTSASASCSRNRQICLALSLQRVRFTQTSLTNSRAHYSKAQRKKSFIPQPNC